MRMLYQETRFSNQILSRTKSVQYDGNQEIEDRIVIESLKGVDAILVGIYDGHGGKYLAEYVHCNMVDLIENEI